MAASGSPTSASPEAVVKLVILGRDGVINRETDSGVSDPDEWVALPRSLEAIARLNRAGFRVIVATHQPGVGEGRFSLDRLHAIHRRMGQALGEVGGVLDGIYVCTHAPGHACGCQPPQPGLFREIQERIHRELRGLPVITDCLETLQAAKAVEAAPMLVLTGRGQSTLAALESNHAYPVFADLGEAVDAILAGSRP